ncbi:MAG TPA: nucleotide exchange factor GrpE [Candidatus Excrementavichristensenella intestinipullorum]|nr:nucleotide exchange factor GrpE [Candidatus Excrementavichristensenella intestinipullorum]
MDEEKITQAQETGESVPQGEETAPQTGEQPQEQSAQEAPAATEDEWRAALEQAVKDRDAYLAMAQRAQADFQNFKRRNQQVRADAYDDGVREALTALLPTIDNLERAVQAAQQQGEGGLLDGVKMTLKLLMEAAGKLGLEEVPALGEKFDPELHNAVMRAEEGEPGTVLEVFEKGYRARGRIIRYAMVKVAVE